MLVPVLAIGGLLLFASMGGGSKPRRTSPTPSTPSGPTPKRGTGNGQDVETFCTSRGGRIEEMETLDGQKVRMCVFADGKMVEAEAYARGAAQPQCPVDMVFNMATGLCEIPPDPVAPTPGQADPTQQNLQVCEQRLAESYAPWTATGGNLGDNWVSWLYDAYRSILAGTEPETAGGQSMMEIWEEGMAAGDPNFTRWAGALAPGAGDDSVDRLAGLGLLIFSGGVCDTWPLVGRMPPFASPALSVWQTVYETADQAVNDHLTELPGPSPLPGITPSGPPRTGPSITPSGPPRPDPSPLPGVGDDLPPVGPNPNASGYANICPPNFAYNALHDVCCPDGFSYDSRADTCKPTAFVGAARHNLPVDRRGVPRRDWGPMGATKVPRGSIAIKRRDGSVETKSLAGFVGACGGPGGCRAKWVPNRGQRMGNRRS